jgi:hypothetical protein
VVCGVWLLVAIVFVVARPGVARRAGVKLTAEEGLATTPAARGAENVR